MSTRRQFLSSALGAGALFAAGTLVGCSGDSSGEAANGITVQLSWLKDVSFAGTYIAAEKGWFGPSVSSVDLRAGGPNVVVPTVVAAGTALIGMASTDVTATSRASGSGLRIIGARFQRNPFCIISLPDRPLDSPQDMVGRRIGVSPTNTLAFQSFLTTNGIPLDDVEQVPVQFDVTPLTDGEVDGLLGYYTSQPSVLAEQGIAPSVMLLADHGYALFENVYVVDEGQLESKREMVVDFLRGEQRGWQANLDDPSLGVDLTIQKYGGTGLDAATQERQNRSQNELIRPELGVPLLGMSNADISANLEFLRDRLRIDVDDSLFDTSVLAEL